MPFALIIVGLALLVAGVRDKQGDLFSLVKGDLTGPNNFIFWVIAILIIGAFGYLPKLGGISKAFLVLVIVVLFVGGKNPVGIAFTNAAQKFLASLGGGSTAPASTSTTVSNLPVSTF